MISRVLPSALVSSHFVGSSWVSLATASPVTVALHLSHQLRTTHPHLEVPQSPWPQPTSNPRCLPAHSIKSALIFHISEQTAPVTFPSQMPESYSILFLWPTAISHQSPNSFRFPFLFFKNFIYGCAGSSLLYRFSSSCREWRLLCCGARAPRLSSRGTWGKLLCSVWDHPVSGIECVSPTLAGWLYHWATREAPDLLSKHHLNTVNFSSTLCSACLNSGLTTGHPKPYLLTLPLSLNNMFFIWSVISVKNINQNKALACLKSGWGK